MEAREYDFIIIGAGAAGLMLAASMGEDAYFKNKSILLLEKQHDRTNDRTWSFWEKGIGEFDAILLKEWTKIGFKDPNNTLVRDITPYTYKTLRGLDYYQYQDKKIKAFANVTRQYGTVKEILESGSDVRVSTDRETYRANYVFSSVMLGNPMQDSSKYPLLQQHFIGWYVQTQEPVFDSKVATFMDFSIPQKGNTRFIYVLPTSPNEGLVEYTLFSKELLPESEYEEAIKDYIRNDLKCTSYTISEKEKGSIPMTAYNFSRHNSNRIIYIGTAGGWTKPSTGFTFSNIQKNTKILIRNIKSGRKPIGIKQDVKHRFYDTLLLDILNVNNAKGREIFSSMFRKRKVQDILKFLSEETSFFEEVNMILACPKGPFLRAFWKRLFH